MIRRSTLIAAVLPAFGAILLAALPACAAEYGAIAWDEGAHKYGVSWRQSTQQRADEVAISECGASGCKVVVRGGPAVCAAVATTENGKIIGAATRKDRAEARLASLKDCEKRKAGDCAVRFTDCNK